MKIVACNQRPMLPMCTGTPLSTSLSAPGYFDQRCQELRALGHVTATCCRYAPEYRYLPLTCPSRTWILDQRCQGLWALGPQTPAAASRCAAAAHRQVLWLRHDQHTADRLLAWALDHKNRLPAAQVPHMHGAVIRAWRTVCACQGKEIRQFER